jgi:hypothetical protein
MELHFQTKEESNRKQLEDFEIVQNRTFYHFLRLMEKVNQPMKRKTTLIEFYYPKKSKLICFKKMEENINQFILLPINIM